MCRNNEQQATRKGETWSRGTNSRLPFELHQLERKEKWYEHVPKGVVENG